MKMKSRTIPLQARRWKPPGRECVDAAGGVGKSTARNSAKRILPDLFTRGLSQRVVDPILPAASALLEVFENILIDPQRDQLLHIRNRRLFRRRVRHLRGGPLERRFRFGARVVQGSRSSWLIRH